MSDATPARSKPAKKAPSKRGGRRAGSGRKRTKAAPPASFGAEVAAVIDALVGRAAGGPGGMVLTRLIIEVAIDPRLGKAVTVDPA